MTLQLTRLLLREDLTKRSWQMLMRTTAHQLCTQQPDHVSASPPLLGYNQDPGSTTAPPGHEVGGHTTSGDVLSPGPQLGKTLRQALAGRHRLLVQLREAVSHGEWLHLLLLLLLLVR